MKAYRNQGFLGGRDARPIRILAEFLEPLSRFRYYDVKDTVVFFGSARIVSRTEALKRVRAAQAKIRNSKRPSRISLRELENAEIALEMSRYYEDAMELARKVALWSKALKMPNRFVVCSGGGPGIMEAANKGALAAGGKSMGLNISLPLEQYPNSFITPELNLEFHYFFMRKYWFMYLGKALVAFPGGFGTMDELMELLTLLQTAKVRKKMTVVLYGSAFWSAVINFNELERLGMISREDFKLFHYADTPDEAFEILRSELLRNYPRETE